MLPNLTFNQPKHEERAVREYVEWQANDEKVIHAEKVGTEHLLGRTLTAWDVRTDKNRWWVITNPTNLYSQELFPSLDYTMTFHIGLATRMTARHAAPTSQGQRDRIIAVWRRWEQASESLDQAHEAEEFQAVGMRLRECLIKLVGALGRKSMVPEGVEPPKRSDFVHWAELIAGTIAEGSSAQEVRGYLRTISKSTWQLVNWLTHARNAVRADGQIALDATQNVIAGFTLSLIRSESLVPDRCPQCSSYQVRAEYRPDLDIDPPYVLFCEKCEWIVPQPPSLRAHHRRKRKKS
jgi:hypothetical protein